MIRPTSLGQGFSFPFRINNTEIAPAFSRDEALVKESIDSILNTRIYERPFRVRRGVPYGTSFRALLFENAEVAGDIIKFEAKRALLAWEPRINLQGVTVKRTKDPQGVFGLLIQVSYRYRSTNRPDNFIKFVPASEAESSVTP